ncbi:MAG: hypothetical protein ACI90V_000334, partial [Bacillariaceae sp.]
NVTTAPNPFGQHESYPFHYANITKKVKHTH